MRVIAGSAKGKRLKAPRGLDTRPITDMIKGALFNVLGSRVLDTKFLDLFAGSGSVGIEAFSRGARQVLFVDSSYEAVKTIKENLANCGFVAGNQVYRGDVLQVLTMLDRRSDRFDIVYIDPPFTNESIFFKVMMSLAEVQVLEPDAIVIIRTPRKKEMPDFGNLRKYRQSGYGESSLHYYSRQEEDPEHDGNISHIG